MTERTENGRYIVVAGRRWRATDPMIPPERAAELRSALMAWRREVKAMRGTAAERPARDGVQAAKVALGDGGPVAGRPRTPVLIVRAAGVTAPTRSPG